MKRAMRMIPLWVLVVSQLAAQTAPPPSAPSGKSLGATVGVYVFPSQGQAADQQSKDEADCYAWAVQQSGSDPFQVQKQSEQQQAQAAQAQQQAQQAGKGAGARGAVGGAAAGALIGEIASDDPGEGAAWGAAAGVVAGRRRGRAAQQQASAQVEQQAQNAQQASAQQLESFRKAFTVCLEGKQYMVKY